MDKFQDYKKLNVWIESRKLCNQIYSLTKAFPKDELFGLTNQLRRASVSIPSNIAEGYGRKSRLQNNQFLQIVLGSAFEVETQLIIAFDQKMLNLKELSETLDQVKSVMKLINGTIRYNRNSEHRTLNTVHQK